VRSEYLYRKKLHDRYWYIPPWIDIAFEFIELNRLFIYIVLFFLGDALRLYRSVMTQRKEKDELELLRTSFELNDNPSQHMSLMNLVSSIDSQVGDDDDIVFDERQHLGDGKEG
jgi:hypothetical protein